MNTRSAWRSAFGGMAVFALGMLLGFGSIPGCGSEKSNDDVGEKSNSGFNQNDAKSPESGNPQKSAGTLIASNKQIPRSVYTDRNGQKWWHKHPYDLWFQNPYQVAGDTRKVGNGGGDVKTPMNGKKVAVKKAGMTDAGMKKAIPKAGGGWKEIVAMSVLESEVKAIRNFLNQKMKTPGVFRENFKKIEYYGSTLATIAHVISLHPDDVTWKKDALFVRDLGALIAGNSTGRSAKEFRATQKPYEDLVSTLNRNKPDLPKPKSDLTFSDFSDRGNMMKRIQDAYNYLDKEIVAADKLKSESAKVLQEAGVYSVLIKAIGHSSFDMADDGDYKKWVNESIEAARKIADATRNGDFEAFQKSRSVIFNRCNECHTKYKE